MTNGIGERFMLKYSDDAECVNKDVLGRCIAREIAEGRGSVHGGVYFDATGVDEARMHDYYQPFIDRYAAVGIDLLRQPVELGCAAHTSLGGILVGADTATDVPGLFAAGEAAGHLHGANRIGGSAGTETIVFGRRAAASILKYLDAKENKRAETDFNFEKPGVLLDKTQIKHIRTEMKDEIGRALDVFRNETELEKAYVLFKSFYERVSGGRLDRGDPENAFAVLSLENDLLTAMALGLSALERRDSCGCHCRADFPDEPKTRYRTEVSLVDGKVCVKCVDFD